MSEDQDPPLSFVCRKVTTHFIYSLAVSSENAPVDWSKGAPADWSKGPPDCRTKGIVPHLELKENNQYWKLAPDRRVSLRPKKDGSPPIEGTLGSLKRLFPTSATCTFRFETTGDTRFFRTDDVLAILNVVTQRKGVPPETGIYLEGVEPDEGLYRRFLDEIEGSDGICRLSPRIGTRLFLAEHPRIAWVDKDERLVDTDLETQSPWVVTIAEVDGDGDVAKAFCERDDTAPDPSRAKMMRVRQYEGDIAPIVFRSVLSGVRGLVLEPAYLQPPTVGGVPGLFSSNLDARLYVSMSRRAILCICPDQKAGSAAYFIPGLLDICELVRARWHSLVILNKLLDRTMFNIRAQIGTRPERQRSLMDMRARLAACLEDPTLYIVAGDALSKLYADLRDMFRLEELRKTLLVKVELADKVFSDLQELEFMKAKKMD